MQNMDISNETIRGTGEHGLFRMPKRCITRTDKMHWCRMHKEVQCGDAYISDMNYTGLYE